MDRGLLGRVVNAAGNEIASAVMQHYSEVEKLETNVPESDEYRIKLLSWKYGYPRGSQDRRIIVPRG